jgi:hypothetical protein
MNLSCKPYVNRPLAQHIYNEAGKYKREQITIEWATIEEITKEIQQAYIHTYDQITASKTENTDLNALMQIQSSITNLEQKYNYIETKTTKATKLY